MSRILAPLKQSFPLLLQLENIWHVENIETIETIETTLSIRTEKIKGHLQQKLTIQM